MSILLPWPKCLKICRYMYFNKLNTNIVIIFVLLDHISSYWRNTWEIIRNSIKLFLIKYILVSDLQSIKSDSMRGRRYLRNLLRRPDMSFRTSTEEWCRNSSDKRLQTGALLSWSTKAKLCKREPKPPAVSARHVTWAVSLQEMLSWEWLYRRLARQSTLELVPMESVDPYS